MITIGEFTGLLMSDFLQARKMADACAASISEEYHVNPLLKGMPVPRYTISEAEIDVPVQIAGVQHVKVERLVVLSEVRRIIIFLQNTRGQRSALRKYHCNRIRAGAD